MHFPPKFLKNLPPTFSVVHLLHHLYGVDAPVDTHIIHGSLGLPDHTTQTASRSVLPFLQDSLL